MDLLRVKGVSKGRQSLFFRNGNPGPTKLKVFREAKGRNEGFLKEKPLRDKGRVLREVKGRF